MPIKRRVTCPECGHRHTITVTGVTRVRRQIAVTSNNRQFQLQLESPEAADVQDRTLAYQAGQVALFGLLCATTAGTVALIAYPPWAGQALALGFTGGLTLCAGWLIRYDTDARAAYDWTKRHLTRPDQPRPVQLVAITPQPQNVNYQYLGDLPVDIDRFARWAAAALRGQSIAYAHWTGSGKLFTRNEYDALLEHLSDWPTHQPLVEKKRGKGNFLTINGKAAFRAFLRQYHPPTPA